MTIEHNVPPSTDPTDADRLRALIEGAHLSQRAAARLLHIDERTMRQWCAGQGTPPESVFRALSPRLTHVENLQRLIESNEKTIAAMQDGRITGVGYGPALADSQSVAVAIDRLRKLNEQHHALVRLDRAFNRQQDAFFELNGQWLPHGSGVPTSESMLEAKAAQKEFHDAQAEVERITHEMWAVKR
jgi:transcriptional regulator with XRE-family HTH domain